VAVPHLDMKATARYNQGLMTPTSADSDADFSGKSVPQVWNDAALLQQQSYSPMHPNTPVHGFATDGMLDITRYDDMHIHIAHEAPPQNALPTPTSCTSSYTGDLHFDSDMYSSAPAPSPPASVLQHLGQSGQMSNFNWPNHMVADQGAGVTTSFASSLGLSAFHTLRLEDGPTLPFSSSYCATPSSSFGDGICASSHQSVPTMEYIVPLETLEDPMQDLSQYTVYDWKQEPSTTVECPTRFEPSSPDDYVVQQGADMKPVSYHGNTAGSKLPMAPSSSTMAKSTNRRYKKKKKCEESTNVFKCERHTRNGYTIEYTVDDMVIKNMSGSKILKTKRFPCEYPGCKKRFARSEHHSRHVKTHQPDEVGRLFHCYVVANCKSGKNNDGMFGRNDNTKAHGFTHLRGWIAVHGLAELQRLGRAPSRKYKHRNDTVSPIMLKEQVLNHFGHDGEKDYQKCFNSFNLSATREFGIHFDWSHAECPMYACPAKVGLHCSTCDIVNPRRARKSHL